MIVISTDIIDKGVEKDSSNSNVGLITGYSGEQLSLSYKLTASATKAPHLLSKS